MKSVTIAKRQRKFRDGLAGKLDRLLLIVVEIRTRLEMMEKKISKERK